MTEEAPLTMSVPEAGKKYFGLRRNAAYDAAARGDLPVIRIGRLLRCPVRALEAMLEVPTKPTALELPFHLPEGGHDRKLL
jgi:Helix-turn-helix domain